MEMISRKHAGLAAIGLITAVFLFFLTGSVPCKQAGSQPTVGTMLSFLVMLIRMLSNRAFPLKAAMPYWAYMIRRQLWNFRNVSPWSYPFSARGTGSS